MYCLQCNEEIKEGWAACPWCGAAIPQKLICSQCGGELDATWKSCPFCGEACSSGQEQKISIQDSVVKGDMHLTDARDQSTHDTTVTNNSTTNVGQQFVGSTVNINQAPSSLDQSRSALLAGREALLRGGSGIPQLREACRLAPGSAEANLTLGIAILSNAQIGCLSHAQVQEAEAALSVSLADTGTKAAAAYALAAIRHCFYMDQSGNSPHPPFSALRSTYAEASPLSDLQKQLLERLKVCDDFGVDWTLALH